MHDLVNKCFLSKFFMYHHEKQGAHSVCSKHLTRNVNCITYCCVSNLQVMLIWTCWYRKSRKNCWPCTWSEDLTLKFTFYLHCMYFREKLKYIVKLALTMSLFATITTESKRVSSRSIPGIRVVRSAFLTSILELTYPVNLRMNSWLAQSCVMLRKLHSLHVTFESLHYKER